ncbi:MAG: RodZ domain-containing protein, partial [Gammaproteobacteria bacterium]
ETAAEVESMAAAAEQQAAGEQPITMASERSESDVAETPAPSSEAASSSEGVGAETTSETAQAASSSEGSVAAGASEAETPVAEAPIAQELPQAGVSGEADQLAAAENSENSQVASAEPEAVQAAPDAVAENAESAAESESAGEAGSQQVVTEAPAPAPVVDPDAPLIMSFTDDCWTSVQAADGERLVYRVVKKGAVLNIHGEAPFRITLGNSDVVKVVYQGDLIDHQPFSRGKIARFVLNADGSAN